MQHFFVVRVAYVVELQTNANMIVFVGISGLLVNICMVIPDSSTSLAVSVGATTTATSSAPKSTSTKNAAGKENFQPWKVLVVPLGVLGSLGLL